MSERKKQIFLEALKKSKKESVMGKLANGDNDPMEPWSKKHAPLDEVNTQILWKYIKAMGRDPRTISLNDRLNLARTDRFKKFTRDHMKYTDMGTHEEVKGVGEGLNEMDKSAPQPGRDGKVSHSTYGSRDKEGDDYFKGKESPTKAITVKQAKKDALDIMRKLGITEADKHSILGKIQRGRELKKKVDSTWKDIGDAQRAGDKAAGSRAFRKHERYANLERPGTWTKVVNKESVAEETEKKYYAIVHKTSKKVHSTYRNLDTAKHVYRQMDKDLRPHLTVMATSNPGDIKEETINEISAETKSSYKEKAKAQVKELQPHAKGEYGDIAKRIIARRKKGIKMASEETVNEAGTGTLMSYIKSKGLNPLTMDGNQKNKYSHSSEFKLFKHRRMRAETSGMGERGEDWNEEKKPVKEAVDQKDTVTMDIPLLIRVLEFIREDVKTDMDLHRVVENLIELRTDGVLTMDHYDKAVSIKKLKEEVEQLDELKKQSDTQDMDSHITREDLRKWFSKTDPEGGWKRINSKGEAIGPCAREPGEPKPKCMSNEKRAKLSKKERAAAVAAKRKHDPVADRPGKGGKPVNVSNFGKGKLSKESVDEACWDTHKQVGMKKKGNKMVPDCVPKNEEVDQIDEKNSPTNPKLWARAKSLARSKFDVYPSAYANGWASKWYKSKGGGWKATSEEVVNEGIYGIEDSPMSATNSVKAMESRMTKEKSKSARMIKAIYKKKGLKKETTYDWEKSEKGGGPNAKIVLKGGKTMTGKDRDTIEIDPVVRTKLNGANGTKPNV